MFYVEGKRVMNSARGGEALCGCGGAHRVGYRWLKGNPFGDRTAAVRRTELRETRCPSYGILTMTGLPEPSGLQQGIRCGFVERIYL